MFDLTHGLIFAIGSMTLIISILVVVNHIINTSNKEEEELSAKKGDKVVTYEDEAPVDTILGVEIFPVIHIKSQEKIYVSLEDISDD